MGNIVLTKRQISDLAALVCKLGPFLKWSVRPSSPPGGRRRRRRSKASAESSRSEQRLKVWRHELPRKLEFGEGGAATCALLVGHFAVRQHLVPDSAEIARQDLLDVGGREQPLPIDTLHLLAFGGVDLPVGHHTLHDFGQLRL